MADDWTHEQTDNSDFADKRNFYKVEKWTKDGSKVDRLLYAGNDLYKARQLFEEAINHRPHRRNDLNAIRRVGHKHGCMPHTC